VRCDVNTATFGVHHDNHMSASAKRGKTQAQLLLNCVPSPVIATYRNESTQKKWKREKRLEEVFIHELFS